MSTTYPELDITDPQEPDNYDDPYRELEQDSDYIAFCKQREKEAIEAQEAEWTPQN